MRIPAHFNPIGDFWNKSIDLTYLEDGIEEDFSSVECMALSIAWFRLFWLLLREVSVSNAEFLSTDFSSSPELSSSFDLFS